MARKTTKRSAKTKKKAPAAKRTATKARAGRAQATPTGTSDKDHLISVIREKTSCSKQVAKETLDALIGTVTASLKKNQKVQIVGFGTFAVARRPARTARNPRTGQPVRAKASKSVRFRAGQTLKRSV